ncbi:Snf5- protein 1 [Irineochytrium annulatum]|nr:Snf5- protein 1 [Irineochytrium annulatum]
MSDRFSEPEPSTSKGRGRTAHVIWLVLTAFQDSKADLQANADKDAQYVPVRLNIDHDGRRLVESFTWNIHESCLTPEAFAIILAEDHGISTTEEFIREVADEIRRQLGEGMQYAELDTRPAPPEELVLPYVTPLVEPMTGLPVEGQSVGEEDVAYGDKVIVIDINCVVGDLEVVDQVQWPLFSTQSPTPEDFARQFAADLGLGGDLAAQVAHAIREQVAEARKDPRHHVMKLKKKTMPGVRRAGQCEEFEPEVRQMTEEEMSRLEQEKKREARRLRRSCINGRSNRRAEPEPVPQQQPTTSFRDLMEMPFGEHPFHHDPTMFLPPLLTSPEMLGSLPSYMYGTTTAGAMESYLPSPTTSLGGLCPITQHQPFNERVTLLNMALFSSPSLPSPSGSLACLSALLDAPQQAANLMSSDDYAPAPQFRPPPRGGRPASERRSVVPYLKTSRAEAAPLSVTGVSEWPSAAPGSLLAEQLEMMRTGVRSGWSSGEVAVKKIHRGFGASANVFNEDDSIDVGEYRRNWKCTWCLMSGKRTPTLRRGPLGSKTLCNACGIWYGKHKSMPDERFQYHLEESTI